MTPESALEIYRLLNAEYPRKDLDADFIQFENPFQILILTILSAQTTDRTVNQIRRPLFLRYPTPAALAGARQEDVEEIIHSAGFYHSKARNIIAASRAIVEEFKGVVPRTMEELVTLPGVGRKTANIVLNHAFGINTGIAVDTHVRRLSQRIGFSDSDNPEVIERDLTTLFPHEVWGDINYLLIRHGRAICTAKKPQCERCIIRRLCRYHLSRHAA